MTGRSRSSWTKLPLLLLLTVSVGGTTACHSTQPRQHWWQFWRPKATQMENGGVYNPDREAIPPPPSLLDNNNGGTSTALPPDQTLPPPPTAVDASTIPEPAPVRDAAPKPVSDLQTLYFNFDSSELSAEAQQKLDQNIQWMKNRPNYEVSIEGHCDERGTDEYNMNLGMHRAKIVRDYLVSHGIDASRLHTISYGEMRPVDPAHTEAAYAKNRRVQFLVY